MQVIKRQRAFQALFHTCQCENRDSGEDDNIEAGLDAFKDGEDIGRCPGILGPVEDAFADISQAGKGKQDCENNPGAQEKVRPSQALAAASVALGEVDQLDNNIIETGSRETVARARTEAFQRLDNVV